MKEQKEESNNYVYPLKTEKPQVTYDPLKSLKEYKKKKQKKLSVEEELESYKKYFEKKEDRRVKDENSLMETKMRLLFMETKKIDENREMFNLADFEKDLKENYDVLLDEDIEIIPETSEDEIFD